MNEITERVARGVALLDEKLPGWDERIDLDELDLGSACRCVLGQTWDGPGADTDDAFENHLDVLLPMEHYRDSEFGFDAASVWSGRKAEYADLTAEWKRVIKLRRAER